MAETIKIPKGKLNEKEIKLIEKAKKGKFLTKEEFLKRMKAL